MEKLVVIVEDDEHMRFLLEQAIRGEGFRVDTASDGEIGLQKIQTLLPDLVLLDLMLPRYGGYDILHRLQDGKTAGIPIIVVTGRPIDRATEETIRQEPNLADILVKPVKLPLLKAAIQKALKRRPSS